MSRSKPPPLPTSAKSFGSDQSSMRQQQPSPDKPQLSSTSSQFQRDPPRSFSQSQREPAGSFRSSQRERESPSSFSRSQPESMSRKPSDTSRSNFLPSRNGSLQEQPLASASSSRTNGSLSRSQQNTSKDSSATTARNMMQTPSKEERNAPGYSSSAASYENKVFDSPPGGNGFAAEEDGSLDQGMDASYGDFKVGHQVCSIFFICLDTKHRGVCRTIWRTRPRPSYTASSLCWLPSVAACKARLWMIICQRSPPLFRPSYRWRRTT